MQALGIIPISINGATAPSVRDVSIDEDVTTKVHLFADRTKAVSKGQAQYKISLTCSLLQDKQQILALLKAAEAQGEVNITFTLGSEHFMLVNCVFSHRGFSSDQNGTADAKIDGVATDLLQVR